jgi:hypothetical protein
MDAVLILEDVDPLSTHIAAPEAPPTDPFATNNAIDDPITPLLVRLAAE